jgi:hypothetical protein
MEAQTGLLNTIICNNMLAGQASQDTYLVFTVRHTALGLKPLTVWAVARIHTEAVTIGTVAILIKCWLVAWSVIICFYVILGRME